MEDFYDPREVLQMRLKSGSHSRLVDFEACKNRAKLKYIDRIPEPERPLPPGKTEHANDRGTRLHTAAELFTKGGVELVPELKKFEAEHVRLRDLYAAGRVSLEGEWSFTRKWEPVAWMSNDTWIRIKADTIVFVPETKSAIVIDFKSGKRWGNEIKHAEQIQLYTIATLVRYPEIEQVTAELWYWDLNDITRKVYTREQGLRFVPNFERRLDLLTTAEDFPPNPNKFVCKWCPYKPVEKGGTGHCPVGV